MGILEEYCKVNKSSVSGGSLVERMFRGRNFGGQLPLRGPSMLTGTPGKSLGMPP